MADNLPQPPHSIGTIHIESPAEFIAKHIEWLRTPQPINVFVALKCLMVESRPTKFGEEVSNMRPVYAITEVEEMHISGTTLVGSGMRRLIQKDPAGSDQVITDNVTITLDSNGGLIELDKPKRTVKAELEHCVLTGGTAPLPKINPLGEGEVINIMLWGVYAIIG
jgi:hypothetical protein